MSTYDGKEDEDELTRMSKGSYQRNDSQPAEGDKIGPPTDDSEEDVQRVNIRRKRTHNHDDEGPKASHRTRARKEENSNIAAKNNQSGASDTDSTYLEDSGRHPRRRTKVYSLHYDLSD